MLIATFARTSYVWAHTVPNEQRKQWLESGGKIVTLRKHIYTYMLNKVANMSEMRRRRVLLVVICMF